MRYFATFFWTFLLVNMASYVVSSMTGSAFHFSTAIIISVVFTVLLFIIAELIPAEPSEEH
ncbi:YjzD family protein [Aeribacillus sp. FSL M8-0235]|uniref:YjzD family protein n=1 Tax=Aeribacillus sp. FSL M8-0235 TaxID=2954576 RepID=UPI0030F7648E